MVKNNLKLVTAEQFTHYQTHKQQKCSLTPKRLINGICSSIIRFHDNKWMPALSSSLTADGRSRFTKKHDVFQIRCTLPERAASSDTHNASCSGPLVMNAIESQRSFFTRRRFDSHMLRRRGIAPSWWLSLPHTRMYTCV